VQSRGGRRQVEAQFSADLPDRNGRETTRRDQGADAEAAALLLKQIPSATDKVGRKSAMSIAPQQAARSCIITVGGGKGGVGKSIVALNLAAALAHDGHRVVIADMDLGAANQHLLLGLLRLWLTW